MNDTKYSPEYFAYLAEGNAKQARKRVAADVLILDSRERILLVNPTYKAFWDLPGGMAESNESPRMAATRELQEELHLNLSLGQLLTIEWVCPRPPWDDLLHFVFYGGIQDSNCVPISNIDRSEISESEFCSVLEAKHRLREDVAYRLDQALRALQTETLIYWERRVT